MKYRFRRRLIYTMLLVIATFFIIMPYRMALSVGRCWGHLAYILSLKYRRLTKEHMRLAFNGSKSESDIARMAHATFVNLGMGLAEVLSLPKMKKRLDSIIDIEGIEKIEAVLKEGKGAIVITGHLGNWELLPMYFAYKGYHVNVIARPIYYEKYNEWIYFLRQSMGVNVIFRTDSPRKVLVLLRKNELVGILPDQDIDSIEGVFVDFFNIKAFTPSAPVKIALMAQAPVVPIFIVRQGNRHRIIVEDPIRVQMQEDRDKAVLSYTQAWSSILESYIRRYPDQWVWMHRRWKTRPPA